MNQSNAELANDFSSCLEYFLQSRNFVPGKEQLSQVEDACRRRAQTLGLQELAAYIDYLEAQPEEFTNLFRAIYGNKNQFFKDPPLWDYLSNQLKSKIESRVGSIFRCWTIDCGRGQEAYSLAITICEAVGPQVFQECVKVFATDVDEDELQFARHASYTREELAGVPQDLISKYFSSMEERFVFRNELRRSLVFGNHSVVEDPSISRMDIVLCRGVRVNYNLELQQRITARMKFALRDNGLLILGQGDKIFNDSSFAEVDSRYGCFTRNSDRTQRFADNMQYLDQISSNVSTIRVNESAYELAPVAQLTVDCDGFLAAANARARGIFELVPQDIGRPFQDLEVSYRPLELRSLMDQARKDSKMLVVNRTARPVSVDQTQLFDVYIQPILDYDSFLGFSIQFDDVTEVYQLQDELVSVNQQLQTANEELQSSHEELETTNEELQSTNEELETTNEELQSTNEELETMNEELRSTNAELETANSEQRNLAQMVETTNSFLQSILSSMHSAVVVLNFKFEIVVWNDYCRNLWGIRFDEVQGQSLFEVDIGLPVEKLRTPLETFMQNQGEYQEVVLDAMNRRGRNIKCIVRISSLLDSKQSGIILLIDDIQSDDTQQES
jgi:two-component system, chemotaxis family, CheB/CheR fusion protein